MTQSDQPIPELSREQERARLDPAFEKTRQRFTEMPSYTLTPAEERELRQLSWLRRKEHGELELLRRRHDGLNQRATTTQLTPDEADELRDLTELLHSDELTDTERRDLGRLNTWISRKGEQYLAATELEVRSAPPANCFDGFASAREELRELNANPDNPPRPRTFSVIALEEVQIIVKRLLDGRGRAPLKAFFEHHVQLRYDGERDAQRGNQPQAPGEHAGQGGATVTRDAVDGQPKYIITVDDATFLKRISWRGGDGQEHSYLRPDFVNAAFTIARAVMTAAVGSKALETFSERTAGKGPKQHPFPEKLFRTMPDSRVGAPTYDEQLDFLALYLVDPDQAQKVNGTWAAEAQRVLNDLNPLQARQLAHQTAIDIPQSQLNLEYLYRTHNLDKRVPNAAGDAGDWLANTTPGFFARLGLGGVAGWFLGGPVVGTAAGVAAGAAVGGLARAPLTFFRTLQGIFSERYDFFYELGVAEADKKEVARIIDRQESGGDRDKRIKDLLVSGDIDGFRRLLLSFSASGDYNQWRVYLYLHQFDKKFRETGGKEITREGYNLMMRLGREANRNKRYGANIGMYSHQVIGNQHRYVLKDWDGYANTVYSVWEGKSEREAMAAANEGYDAMKDGSGRWFKTNEKWGQNHDDPNSIGWLVPSGDIRELAGTDVATDFMGFMDEKWSGDQNFKLKFGAEQIAAIQRMRDFDPKRFPSEFTLMTARNAFEHFDNELPLREKKIHPEDEQQYQTVLNQTAKQAIEDDALDPATLAKLARQTTTANYDHPFGGRATEGRKAFPRMTGRGLLERELSGAERELGKLPIDEALRASLRDVLAFTKQELTDTFPEEIADDPHAQGAILRARVNRILDDPNTPDKERFAAQTWLATLSETTPKVEIMATFRKDLLAQAAPYEQAYLAVRWRDPLLTQLPQIQRDLGALDRQITVAVSTGAAVEPLQQRAVELYDRLERLAGPQLTRELHSNFSSLTAVTSLTGLATTTSAISRDLAQWFIKVQPTGATELAKVLALAEQTRAALHFAASGRPDEATASHPERLAQFRSLASVRGRAETDPLHHAELTDQQLYQELKRAAVAMTRVAEREAVPTKKKEKKKENRDDARQRARSHHDE